MRRLLLAGACALLPALAAAQESDPIASKSIARVHAVRQSVFAMSETGGEFSWLGLFTTPPTVNTVEWPWRGGAEGGAPWSSITPSRQSMILFGNYFASVNDSVRIARAASAFYDQAPSPARSDSLIFPDSGGLANSAGLTAVTVRGDTALFGFGRLGLAYAPLRLEAAPRLFTDSVVTFHALPSNDSLAVLLPACVWNRYCPADTFSVPAGGFDSVISVTVDSSAPDSLWILVATDKGLRRGLWGGTNFPYVRLPLDTANVKVLSVFASPASNLAWAFTTLRFYFSDDHGKTFRYPDTIPGAPAAPPQLTSYRAAPQVAFSGDTSFINFNMDSPGLVLFRKDTILTNVGLGLDGVLLNAADSLEIRQGEGSLTGLAVARSGGASVLVAGTTLKGIFYRRLDQPGKTFLNLNRLRGLKRGLSEVITYPTLFSGPGTPANPKYVRIGYRLSKGGRVTITVFNYAMEKVRVVVKNAPRLAGVRSESVSEDRWDGRDSSGRLVSVGTYYVLVESDQGESAFGKVVYVRGRE